MTPPPRTPHERTQDTLHRLEYDVDAWVSSADPRDGTPYLVPLSFVWDGTSLLFATPAASATVRNLRATGKARLGLGPTRDVVLIEGDVEPLDPAEIATDVADHFAATTGFDPRRQTTPYLYLRIHPQRVQAWREANELDGRELMRAGRWLATS